MNLKAASYAIKRFLLQRRQLWAEIPRYGWRVRVVTRDVVGRHLYKYGVHEPELTDFLCRHVSLVDGDVAIDVGANIGWYSLVLQKLAAGTNAQIFAFEPDPKNFSLLTKNLQANQAQSVTAVQKAVADSAGTMTLHLFGDNNRGRHSLLPINSGETVEIETVSLDQFLDDAGLHDRNIAFIKLDIEGFELIALRGAPRLLQRCPLIMLEYSPGYMRAGGLKPSDLFELMASYAYKPHRLVHGALQAADVAELLDYPGQIDLFWRK